MEASKKLIEEINKRKEEVARDGYHQTVLSIMYEYWQRKDVNMNYDEITTWYKEEYGSLAQFLVLIGKYNQQVTNGGHLQYYFNRYSGTEDDETRVDLNLHKQLVVLMNKSELKDEISQKVFKILEELYITLDTEQYIEEEIYEDGEFEIEEVENENYLEVENTNILSKLDDEYYKICDVFMIQLEQYAKDKITGINNEN